MFGRRLPTHEFHRRILENNGGSWFSFETLIVAMYRSILRPGCVALDGGANIGQHTLQMLSAVSPGGLVIASEPVPELRARLEASIDENKFSRDSIQIVTAGLWDQPGESDFFQVTNQEQHELSGVRNRHYLEPYPVKQIKVQLTTIDAICRGLTRLDFLKLDLEGSEMHALRGGRATVEKFRPIISFEQDQASPKYFGYSWQALLDYFHSAHYKVYDLFGNRFSDAAEFEGCAVWDFVAIPRFSWAKQRIFKAIKKTLISGGIRP